MSVTADKTRLATLMEADRETHIYGLADLEEPLWSASTWYLRDNAAVGVISDGTKWVTGYAMSRVAPAETLDLFAEVNQELPSGSWVTGATGLAGVVDGIRPARTIGAHWRMILADDAAPDDHSDVSWLASSDVDAMDELHSTEPGGAFWLPTMLEANPFVGVWEGDRLIASAGCHVASRHFGVAAIGAVFTRPSHRGRGLGARVTSALCHRIRSEYPTIGLNVEVSNAPALSVYDRLGFSRVFQYEEIELL